MDTESNKDTNGFVKKPVELDVASLDVKKVEDDVNKDNDGDSNSLSLRRGGVSRNSNKKCRRVQWNDTLGNKLVEVLEFEASDDSDSDDDDSCICSIM